MPVSMDRDELAAEAQGLLGASLYRAAPGAVYEEKTIAGRPVILIDAAAGGIETVQVRTAAFSTGRRSYLFTMLAREEAFPRASADLERILSSIKSD